MAITDLSKDYLALNAMLNIYDEDGRIQFDKDKEAARAYFLEHVNQRTVFFHDISEKLDYLVENHYYESGFLTKYAADFIKSLYQQAYAHKFRFPTFVSAYKFFTTYALQTFDSTSDDPHYLERFEDRVVIVALYLANGDSHLASELVREMMTGRLQPATPTFTNAGRKNAGDLVSCFLLRVEDNLPSISRSQTSSSALSALGGGVALCYTNVREKGGDLGGRPGLAKGVIPWMKIQEDTFSAVDQKGQRPGAGAAYLSVMHPDILDFLDTRRENADEKIRIKTLSLGVVIPDIAYELAAYDEWLYCFSPLSVERVYGVPMADLDITKYYRGMLENPEITKYKRIKARDLFTIIAEVQFESGYPYILNEDIANAANPVPNLGRINMSNLCSEILQPNSPSIMAEDGSYEHVGQDISCNLASLNIANVMAGRRLGRTVEAAIRGLNSVATLTSMNSVPSVKRGNDAGRSIGLGQMNLHGYLASQRIHYGSADALDFTNVYFATVLFHALHASMLLARETGVKFEGFEESTYATGEFFDKYTRIEYLPTTERVVELFDDIWLPNLDDWAGLAEDISTYGLHNRHLQAVPPTGSISYVNHATASVHPIMAKVEIREEKGMGRVYYPAFGMRDDNLEFYADAYDLGWKALIDTYSVAQQHVDQGMSLTLPMLEEHTTRDFNLAQIYAHSLGIKTIYYVRIREQALEGTDTEGCVSCAL